MSTNLPDDDLSWGSSSNGAKIGSKNHPDSAFSDPILVEDISTSDQDKDPELDPANGYEMDGNGTGVDASADAAEKLKPNVAILALVGVLALGVLGGAGLFVSKQFNKPSSNRAQEVALTGSPSGLNPSNAGFPMDAGNAQPPVNVFDAAPAAPALPASSVATTNTATLVSTAAPPLVAASAVAQPVVVAAPATVAPALTPPAATAKASTSELEASVAAAKAEVVAAPLQKPVKAKPAKVSRQYQARKPVSKAPIVVAASEQPKARPVRRVRGAKAKPTSQVATAKAELPAEEFILPKGMKVRSIYPPSGPDSQAWISDANGKVEVVHVGDTLRGGARVISIVGAKGQVLTSSGLLTTTGVTK